MLLRSTWPEGCRRRYKALLCSRQASVGVDGRGWQDFNLCSCCLVCKCVVPCALPSAKADGEWPVCCGGIFVQATRTGRASAMGRRCAALWLLWSSSHSTGGRASWPGWAPGLPHVGLARRAVCELAMICLGAAGVRQLLTSCKAAHSAELDCPTCQKAVACGCLRHRAQWLLS